MKRKASISHDEATIRELRKSPEFAAEYLRAALEDADEPRVLLIALRRIAEARGGIAKVAKAAGIERESLYRALSRASPSFVLSLNCDRIRQRRPAFRRHTTQKVLVLGEHQVVVCLRFLALLPSWILQADVVLALPRAPEFHDNVLRASCRDCAIHPTRSADPALAGQALLGTNDQALSAVPDLACGARLLDDFSSAVCPRAGRQCAGAILALRLSRRTRLARPVFAQLAAQVGCDRL